MIAVPGAMVFIACRQGAAWLWSSPDPIDWDESFSVAPGSCGVLLSAPVGGEEDMVLLLCDGRVGWVLNSALEIVNSAAETIE